MIVLSHVITNREGMQRMRASWNKMDKAKAKFLGRSKKETQEITLEQLGGGLSFLDRETDSFRIIREIDLPSPLGMTYSKERKSLFVAGDCTLYEIQKGEVINKFEHPLFKDLHDVKCTQKGTFIVTSTGIDAVLEIELGRGGEVILMWYWLATDHGYTKTPSGTTKHIDINKDYRKLLIPTPEQTTHVNSCIEIDDETLLATLFHQGTIIKIDRRSGDSVILMSNLKSPHNIRKYDDYFLVSDTRSNRALIMNKDFSIKKVIQNKFSWVQDTIKYGNNFLVSDVNNGKLLYVSENGDILNETHWDTESHKLGSIEVIPSEYDNYVL